MKTRSRWVALLSAAVIMAGAAATACADEASPSSSRVDGMLRKLGRGLANIVTCPAELIRTPDRVGRKDGYVAALSVGVIEAAWRTVQRAVVGLFEVATFYAEIPPGYGPLMKPEFVWAHGDWGD